MSKAVENFKVAQQEYFNNQKAALEKFLEKHDIQFFVKDGDIYCYLLGTSKVNAKLSEEFVTQKINK